MKYVRFPYAVVLATAIVGCVDPSSPLSQQSKPREKLLGIYVDCSGSTTKVRGVLVSTTFDVAATTDLAKTHLRIFKFGSLVIECLDGRPESEAAFAGLLDRDVMPTDPVAGTNYMLVAENMAEALDKTPSTAVDFLVCGDGAPMTSTIRRSDIARQPNEYALLQSSDSLSSMESHHRVESSCGVCTAALAIDSCFLAAIKTRCPICETSCEQKEAPPRFYIEAVLCREAVLATGNCSNDQTPAINLRTAYLG